MSVPVSERAAQHGAAAEPTWKIDPWVLFIASAVGYWLGSRLAFELGEMTGLAAVFFVPAGITLALLIRTPPSRWWLVLTAAALVEFGNDIDSGLSVPSAIGFAAANVAEPLVGATLTLRWAHSKVGLARRRSVAAFLIGAVAIGPLVGALIGASTDYAANADGWWETLWQWWLGDALGVLVVGGAILAWSAPTTRLTQPSQRLVPMFLLVAAVPVVTTGVSDVPLEFFSMAMIIVCGGVFGPRGAAGAAAIAAISTAVVLGVEDAPVWVGVSDATAWAIIKAKIGVATIAGLVLAAESYERQAQSEVVALADAERKSAAFTRRVLDQLITFVTVTTPDGRVITTNHTPLGTESGTEPDIIGIPVWEAPWWRHDPVAQQRLADAIARSADGEVTSYDVPMLIDGNELWVELQISPLRNDDGVITHLIKTCTDLTERREVQLRLAAVAAAERETRQRVELLGRVASNLAAAVTIGDIAEAVLTEIKATLGVEWGELDEVAGDHIFVHNDGSVEKTQLPVDSSGRDLTGLFPGAAAISSNAAIILNSREEIAEKFPTRSLRGESVGAFPIRSAGSEPTAALVVGAAVANWFTDDRIELLTSIANQVAQAMQRARLHHEVVEARDREHGIAVRLQNALLPDRLVEHPELDVAARYRAAAEALTVGGDWYDTFVWPDGHIGLMVGDVVGHDLEAAATMGRIRAALAAIVPLGPPDPSAVLDALDACACGPDGAEFVTAACVVLDTTMTQLTYASAGHPPPLFITPQLTATWLDQALSTPAGRPIAEKRISALTDFPPGATVVLYTDGLIERRDASIDIGMNRLADAALQVSDAGPATRQIWLDKLLACVADEAIGDDVAVLVAQRQSSASRPGSDQCATS